MSDYTLRDIPNDLHRAWKAAAALRDLTMKDYCFLSLQFMIKQDYRKEPESKKGAKKK